MANFKLLPSKNEISRFCKDVIKVSFTPESLTPELFYSCSWINHNILIVKQVLNQYFCLSKLPGKGERFRNMLCPGMGKNFNTFFFCKKCRYCINKSILPTTFKGLFNTGTFKKSFYRYISLGRDDKMLF